MRGNDDGLSAINWNPSDDPCADPGENLCDSTTDAAFRVTMFQVGSGDPTAITSWTWNSGFDYGTDIVGSSQTMADVYEGDIVKLVIPVWGVDGSTSMPDWFDYYRVLCARWDNTNHGTDCTGVSVNNTIKIDRVHNFDMDGSDYSGIGPFSTGTIEHIERIGGGTVDDNQMPTYIGFENITLQTIGPEFMNEDFNSIILWNNHFDTWTYKVNFKKWGPLVEEIKEGRHLALSNNYTDEVWKPRCTGAITLLAATNPMQVTISSPSIGGKCGNNRWGQNTEPTIWFPPAMADNADSVVQGLADKMFVYSCIDCDSTDGSVTVSLTNFGDDTNYDGSSLSDTTPSEGYVVLLNQYGVAKIYVKGSGIQLIDNSFYNVRIGVIYQSGANNNVTAYNVFETGGTDKMCGRSFFIHGGYMQGGIWEGNETDCGFVTAATAETGSPIGPGFTMFRNRHWWRGAEAHAMNEACGAIDAGMCQERYDNQGKSSDDHNYILNFLGGWQHTSYHLGTSNNSGDFGGAPLSPWGYTDLFVGSNLWHSEAMVERVGTAGAGQYENETNNPTFTDTYKPDLAIERDGGDANSNVDAAPAAWSSRVFPTSSVYDTTQAEPSWWCSESGTIALGTFPGIGADVDDANGGSPSFNMLPAERRRRGLSCTAVSGIAAPTPVMTGVNWSSGAFR